MEPDPKDPQLDALLGRAAQPTLSFDFADKVLHAVQPAEAFERPAGASRSASPNPNHRQDYFPWRRFLAFAAALALCAAGAWSAARKPATHPTEEEALLNALSALDLNSGDLALIAQLGEVVEAEISEHSPWITQE